MTEDLTPVFNIYSSRYSNIFNNLSRPLNHFGLNAFFYCTIDSKGGYTMISNRPDATDVFFSNRLFIFNPFMCHPDNYSHNQMILTTDFPHKGFHESQKMITEASGIENLLCIYKKEKDLTHLLQFSSSDKKIPLSSVCINNLSILSSFGDYFIKEWKLYFSQMEPYKINIANLLGPMFFEKNPKLQMGCEKALRRKFLKEIGILNEGDIECSELSKRQMDCIERFLEGKTAKQIAKNLHLSNRTIEGYLEEIKSKFGCHTKSELFEILHKYKTYNLL